MILFAGSLTTEATPEAVWAVLGRHMHIDAFAPQIVTVEALTQGEIGGGSRHRNHFQNGTSLVEEATHWQPDKGYAVRLSDMAALPLHEASSTVRITPEGESAKAAWTLNCRVKYGPVGWLLGQTAIKRMMGKIIDGNPRGLADAVRTDRAGRGQNRAGLAPPCTSITRPAPSAWRALPQRAAARNPDPGRHACRRTRLGHCRTGSRRRPICHARAASR
ncbi:MAG: SRPBCC family protein [Pseudomonadota bacterium]